MWHHTAWRIWLFIAQSDERWLHYQFSLPNLHFWSSSAEFFILCDMHACNKVWRAAGEIWNWSLLGVKGLICRGQGMRVALLQRAYMCKLSIAWGSRQSLFSPRFTSLSLQMKISYLQPPNIILWVVAFSGRTSLYDPRYTEYWILSVWRAPNAAMPFALPTWMYECMVRVVLISTAVPVCTPTNRAWISRNQSGSIDKLLRLRLCKLRFVKTLSVFRGHGTVLACRNLNPREITRNDEIMEIWNKVWFKWKLRAPFKHRWQSSKGTSRCEGIICAHLRQALLSLSGRERLEESFLSRLSRPGRHEPDHIGPSPFITMEFEL